VTAIALGVAGMVAGVVIAALLLAWAIVEAGKLLIDWISRHI